MFGGLFKFFRIVWFFVDGARRVVFNLVLLILLVAFVVALVHPGPEVPNGAALIVRPAGSLVEQGTIDPSISFFTEETEKETALSDLLEAVRAARDDPRIKLLALETDELDSAGLSKLAELRAAIIAFKASGKPVLARGEHFNQGHYYLASVADEVHLAPDGAVLLQGLARFSTYFRGALDKLGIKVHVFRVGEYKSFAEPFTRSNMSDEDRQSTRELLDELWGVIRAGIIEARKLPPERFDRYVSNYLDALKSAKGDAAKAAQTAGLIDRFSTRDEWRARIKERLGDTRKGQDFQRIDVSAYLAATRNARSEAPEHIAVLVAQGTIVDGEQPPGVVGGDSFASLIREARKDSRVKALVIRIDSPGGSAGASEIIRRELELTRQAGKPVIASMSSVAASGGYWIAAGADEIFAAPATLTGSIGVFGLFPEFSEPVEKLGLTIDGVATAPLAGAPDPMRPLAPEVAGILQLDVEHAYDRFIDLVAKARKMETSAVDQVARGRVWSGAKALKLGLVDKPGGLDAALAAAAERAGLTDYAVVWPTPKVSPMRQFLRQLIATTGFEATASAPGASAAVSSPARRVVDRLAADLRALSFWNDSRHIYAHCLCEIP